MRILIVEGNTVETTRVIEASGGRRQSAIFEALFGGLGDVEVGTVYPADGGYGLPMGEDLAKYDGVVWTGSALNVYQGGEEVGRQVELARRALLAGCFVYGSCWGLQVGVAACGGEVFPNPLGREFGVARGIELNAEGRAHPLLRGRQGAYEALALHRDIVGIMGGEVMTVLAGNALCPVQAAELRLGEGIFWGVQYHPEYSFGDIASGCRRYGEALVREGMYEDLGAVGRAAEAWVAADSANGEEAARAWEELGVGGAVTDAGYRALEVLNWVEAVRLRV
jgi:GMP synthase (glutamine-hydrolysing)